MPEPVNDPCQVRLERHLRSSEFESGVAAGLWRLVSLDWPYLIVTITAGDGNELGMRLHIDGYPSKAPAGQPWDIVQDMPLPVSRWPTGGTAFQIFRSDWSVQNGNAPYMACDRVGLGTHPDWATQHPHRAWNPGRTITFYLREIHHELRAARLPAPTEAGA